MFFIKGILIGIFISLPFGPIGIICLKNIIVEGRKIGFASGVGAATSDIIYSLVVSIGFTTFSKILFENENIIKLIIGIILLGIGIKIFFTSPIKERKLLSNGAFNSYIRLFVLGLSNISTIFLFFSIFTTLNLFIDISVIRGLNLVMGIFTGSVIWWFILSHIIHIVNSKPSERHIRILNKISGLIVSFFGIFNIGYIILFKLIGGIR